MKAGWKWAAGLAALVLVSPLQAQILGGRVMDRTSNEPVQDAVVEVLNPAGRRVHQARTDRDGFFVFELRQAGEYRVRTARIGYSTTTSGPVQVEERQSVQVEIKLSTGEVQLEALTVTARSQPPRSNFLEREGFYDREKMGFGLFLTSAELNQRHATQTADLFRGLAGVQVTSAGGTRYNVSMSRNSGNCPPRILLDAGPVSGSDLDSFVQPQDIEAIEIYRGPSETPGRWMANSSSCGLIVIWTKRGERNRR
jgi:hypothetical protein